MVMDLILNRFETRARFGRACGVTRSTASRWFKAGCIPPEYWQDVVRVMGGDVSIEMLYREFYGKRAA